jgi:MFS family permease
VLGIAWLGWVFDIMDTGLFNFAKGPMLTQMVGPTEYRLHGPRLEADIQAVFLVGWALGGLVFGVLADRWGRTKTLIATVLLYCLFTGLTALCHTPEQVAAARFLTALGIGGEWAAGAALVAESFGDAMRAGAAALLQTAAAAGPVFAALANLALAGRPWQLLFLVGVAPAFMAVFARMQVHGSPATGEAAGSKFGAEAQIPKTGARFRSPLSDLWADVALRRNAVAAMFVGAVGVTGAMTAVFWQPNLVAELSRGLPKVDVDTRKSQVAMLSHVGTLIGVLVVPSLCDRFGRRATIGAFFLASPIAAFAAIGLGSHGSYERLFVLSPLVNFFAIGVSAAFVLYFPELFPSRVRATGAGLAYNVGRALSIPIPIATAWLIASFGGSIAAGVLLSGSIYLVGLAALPFLPETRGLPLRE